MRLIDADALKKEFPKDSDWEYPVNTNSYVCETIDAQPTIEEHKTGLWIPCSERLPKEERKHYWICTDTGYQCECRWTNNRFGLGESDEWGWSVFDTPQYSKVIAWMPLPELYKGECNEID